uniref:ANK_REP_REGION domain-containing protein n=1 Tax=Anopheles minimus TaxID=112268 RepID=A0A182WGL4_9DIPT
MMNDSDIWNAVKAGDCTQLRKLLDDGKPSEDIGKQIDSNRWTILHHAAISGNLDMVKLVADRCNPDIAAQNTNGLTPLLLACDKSVSVEIIIYLLLLEKDTASLEANQCISPLHYAVFQSRIDLAMELIAHGVKVSNAVLQDPTSPLYIVAFITGNGEMLKCLLDAANVEVPFVEEDGLTLLEVFAGMASYSVEKKVDCFEIFYNLAHSNTNATECGLRYNVHDILKSAMLSVSSSTSLIPYFIATERKWETRKEILSLYERLIPVYDSLALFVLCECGTVSRERKELDDILREPCLREFTSEVTGDMEQLYRNTVCADGEESVTDAMQLLEDFVTFTKTIQSEFIRNAVQSEAEVALMTTHLMFDKPLMKTRQELVAYQSIIDCMVSMCGSSGVESILEVLLSDAELLMRPDLVFPLLKHCTTLFMCPDTIPSELKRVKLYQWFMHLFGTWKTIASISRPQLHVFTLQRLARDVVRETVWNGLDATARRSSPFFDRLQSLNIPNELKGYLRYSDYTSFEYFLCHMHDAIDYLNESRQPKEGD